NTGELKTTNLPEEYSINVWQVIGGKKKSTKSTK
ncbi:hypothetical protein LCGC14_2772320, partial [marine sediment metagenome]